MASSVQRTDFLLNRNLHSGENLVLSNATLHERGVTLGLYSNLPAERVHSSDQCIRIVQIGAHPARAEHRKGGRSIEFMKRPRSLTIVPPGITPDVRLHTVSKLIVCEIDKRLMGDFAEELDRQPKSPLQFKSGISDEAITGILALMVNDSQTGSQLGNLYTETLFHALAIKLLQLDCTFDRAETSTISVLPANKLNKIKELIEVGLKTDLSLKVLASESGYSRAHFLRMFHASTGTTPHRYVLERRIDRARRLLREKTESLDNIAATCGFSSQTHMADVFRRTLNTTPMEYRRKI